MKLTNLQSLIRHDFDLTHFICIKVGHFYWILGGASVISDYSYKKQKKTSMFSLKKESWIEGPDLPKIVITSMVNNIMDYICITALNRTSVIFIGIGESMQEVLLMILQKILGFNWKIHPKRLDGAHLLQHMKKTINSKY